MKRHRNTEEALGFLVAGLERLGLHDTAVEWSCSTTSIYLKVKHKKEKALVRIADHDSHLTATGKRIIWRRFYKTYCYYDNVFEVDIFNPKAYINLDIEIAKRLGHKTVWGK